MDDSGGGANMPDEERVKEQKYMTKAGQVRDSFFALLSENFMKFSIFRLQRYTFSWHL